MSRGSLSDELIVILRPGVYAEEVAKYWHLAIGDELLLDFGWSYPEPGSAFAAMRDHVAFYAARLDRCLVDGDPVIPQPGGFYGGWITPDVAGPFKGVTGSAG